MLIGLLLGGAASLLRVPCMRAPLPPRSPLAVMQADEVWDSEAWELVDDMTTTEQPRNPAKAARKRAGCYGCGADLQCDMPSAAGFVEPERYEIKRVHKQLRLLLCTRCRSLSQGQILPAVVEGRLKAEGASTSGIGVTTPEQLRAELAPLAERKVIVVLLVDVTDVHGSFLPRVRDLVGGNPIVLIGTKADLLPKGTRDDDVLDWLGARLTPRLNVIDLHLVSSRTGDGVRVASQAILRERKGRDVFVMGAANVGKSLFIGSFLEHALGGRGKRLPLSSATPGTTLRTIGLDCFDGGSMLFDTPGVHLQHRLSAQLLPAELKALVPRGRMRPYTPRAAAAGSTFFWGGLARIDVVEGPACLRLTFCAYGLQVEHVQRTSDADAYYGEHVGVTLTPPLTPESAAELGGLVMKKRVELDLHEMEQAADVSVSGLGWVSVSALASLSSGTRGPGSTMRAVLDVWAPKAVEVGVVRPPMPIGGLPVVAIGA